MSDTVQNIFKHFSSVDEILNIFSILSKEKLIETLSYINLILNLPDDDNYIPVNRYAKMVLSTLIPSYNKLVEIVIDDDAVLYLLNTFSSSIDTNTILSSFSTYSDTKKKIVLEWCLNNLKIVSKYPENVKTLSISGISDLTIKDNPVSIGSTVHLLLKDNDTYTLRYYNESTKELIIYYTFNSTNIFSNPKPTCIIASFTNFIYIVERSTLYVFYQNNFVTSYIIPTNDVITSIYWSNSMLYTIENNKVVEYLDHPSMISENTKTLKRVKKIKIPIESKEAELTSLVVSNDGDIAVYSKLEGNIYLYNNSSWIIEKHNINIIRLIYNENTLFILRKNIDTQVHTIHPNSSNNILRIMDVDNNISYYVNKY